MQLTMQVSRGVATLLQQRDLFAPEVRELVRISDELGVDLEPLHPGTTSPLLIPYFTVEVPDVATAERVMERLRHVWGVEAVYVKPPDEAP
jgi:hypothetical protein